jgi:hypothetical protein
MSNDDLRKKLQMSLDDLSKAEVVEERTARRGQGRFHSTFIVIYIFSNL